MFLTKLASVSRDTPFRSTERRLPEQADAIAYGQEKQSTQSEGGEKIKAMVHVYSGRTRTASYLSGYDKEIKIRHPRTPSYVHTT